MVKKKAYIGISSLYNSSHVGQEDSKRRQSWASAICDKIMRSTFPIMQHQSKNMFCVLYVKFISETIPFIETFICLENPK